MMTDCNNRKHGPINSMDRLSDLPDFIIHSIISNLYQDEAYRTTVLSKRWTQVFTTNPQLDFYQPDCPTDMIPRHLEYIDARMQKYSKENLRITKFALALPATKLLLACKVDEWLEIAVRKQVADFFLGSPANYKLPSILFRAKSLRLLGCQNVEIPYYEALDLVSLVRLRLCQVLIGERMLFHIVSSCPLLKDLTLSGCSGFKNLVIPSHSKLEYLHFDGNIPGRVILETSSLKSFLYLPNDKTPWLIISNRGLLRNLRHLDVYSLSITDKALAELLPELASLEKFEISSCHMLTSIKISNNQLKQISLEYCVSLLNVVIDAPSLKEFKFDGKIDPSLSITISSQANCSMHIYTRPCYFETGGFYKLKKLLTGLNSCNVLKITLRDKSFKSGEDDIKFDEEESGNAELGPAFDIRELKLDMSDWELSSSSLSAFLNGLFWICHPNFFAS